MKRIKITIISACACLAASTFAASFQGLGDLPGGTFSSVADGVSADGKVVVGSSQSANGLEAFRWTTTNGMVGLGDLPGGSFYSFATGVSADGSVVAGQSSSTAGFQAFHWTVTNGMTGLGDLSGGSFSSIAYAVSGNGEVIVGESSSTLAPNNGEAFRWTATNGMTGLGGLPGVAVSSHPYAVSADGSVIVGQSASLNSKGGEAFRWTAATGMVAMGDIPGGYTNSVAYGISADGLIMVGRGISDTDSHGITTEQACKWTAPSNLTPLGFLPCDTWSTAHACSGDGSVIVGDPYQGSGDCAFIWDAQHGIRNLHTVLVNDYGLNLTGWQLSEALAITPDGKIIVGFGIDPAGKSEAWIADLTPPLLAVSRTATNMVLSWGTNTSGFVLEQTPTMTDFNSWSTNSITVSVSGSNFVATNILGAGQQFFRLRKP